MVVRPWRSYSPRSILLLAAGLLIAITAVGIGIRAATAVHPRVPRAQAIAAVVGSNRRPNEYSRVEAKYMRRTEAENVLGHHLTAPDIYVWVVAISGSWGPTGEHAQGQIKSAVAVIEDRPGLHLIMSYSSATESWPSIFDRLPDMASSPG